MLLCLPAPLAAEGLRERLRALSAPAVQAPTDMYADEKASDLARIAAEAPGLFGPDDSARIALFTGPGCAECATAVAQLAGLATRLNFAATVLDIAVPEHAATMDRLGLDTVPSYVMPDRLIRGQMPIFVLERYLTQ